MNFSCRRKLSHPKPDRPIAKRRVLNLCSALLLLTLAGAACGSFRTRKASTPPPTLQSEPTTRTIEKTSLTSQQSTPLGVSSPTETPFTSAAKDPSGAASNPPPVRLPSGQRPFKFGVVTGSGDPFFATILNGAQQSAVNQGIELFIQIPKTWRADEQKQLLEALLARGDLDALIISPADPQALIPTLQKAIDAGIPVITIQTTLAENTSVLPLFAIAADDYQGGYLACQALVDTFIAAEEESGNTPVPPRKVYIQKGQLDFHNAEARAQGCSDYLSQNSSFILAGIDANQGDPEKANQQITEMLEHEPELGAIVCTELVCAQTASQILASQGLSGEIKIISFDGTPEAVALLDQGLIDILVTPKPVDMGYMAVAMAAAALDGITSLPGYLSTGWVILNRQDLEVLTSARWLYEERASGTLTGNLQSSTTGLNIAFVAGINDPYYHVMQRGAQQAATNMGVVLHSQFPQNWSADEQSQIIDNFSASIRLDALLIVPTDPLTLIPSLQKMQDEGIQIVTLDTSLDPTFIPLSAIGSENEEGGYFTCHSLAEALGGKGKIYIQNVAPGITTTDARERGCLMAFQEFPEISLIAINYNDDDPAKSQAQLNAVLLNYPDLSAVFCTTVVGAQAVGQLLASQGLSEKVKVATFDATADTIGYLQNGVIDMVTAQKPADMGYLAVLFATARLDGVTDLPAHYSTGFVLLTRENMDDPYYARYFYTK